MDPEEIVRLFVEYKAIPKAHVLLRPTNGRWWADPWGILTLDYRRRKNPVYIKQQAEEITKPSGLLFGLIDGWNGHPYKHNPDDITQYQYPDGYRLGISCVDAIVAAGILKNRAVLWGKEEGCFRHQCLSQRLPESITPALPSITESGNYRMDL